MKKIGKLILFVCLCIVCLSFFLNLYIAYMKYHYIQVKHEICKLNPKLDPVIARKIGESIYEHSKQNDIPWRLIVALINTESTLATSKSGAIGLMQIMRKFHKDKLEGLSHYEIYHIDNNIRIGTLIMKEYLEASDNNPEKALFKYFGKESDEYARKVLNLYTKMSME